MIYTSNYAKAIKLINSGKCSPEDFVQISNSKPDYFPSITKISLLVPDWNIVSAIKNNEITSEQYTRFYTKNNLALLTESFIEKNLYGKILLCYCGAGKFCHRHVVRNYLNELGYECEEL